MRNWIIAAMIIVAVLGGGYFVSTNLQQKDEVTPSTTQQKVQKIKATLVVKPGDKDSTEQEVEIEKSKTALDLTKKAAAVETSGEGEMAFITSIGGRAADASRNEFWELVINDESSQVGAGSYVVKDGDKIEWRISTF